MPEQSKFWLQTLLIPIVLALVGFFFFNSTLQNQQRVLDKIKFTDQVINEAFDSNNPDKAFALATKSLTS